jgi:hypothetical protein
MNTDNYGVYGSESKSFGGTFPVWKNIDNEGIEDNGGTFKVISSFATEYPTGTIIPTGAPVNLAGGILTVLPTYEVTDIYAATVATVVKVKAAGVAKVPVVGDIVMLAPATVGTTGTAIAITAVALADGKYELTVGTAAFGSGVALAVGDILVGATAAGSGKSILTVPTGLLRREVYIGAGATVATGASVFHGNILVDRIPPIPACVKSVLTMIKFTPE